MTIKELEKEIEETEAAMFSASGVNEWDRLVHKYNALKILWYQMSGNKVELETVNIADLNTHKNYKA